MSLSWRMLMHNPLPNCFGPSLFRQSRDFGVGFNWEFLKPDGIEYLGGYIFFLIE